MINLYADISTKHITNEDFLNMEEPIKNIIEKKEWTGQDIGILNINEYIVEGYLLDNQPELKAVYEKFKYDKEKYEQYYKKYRSLIKEDDNKENLNDIVGYTFIIRNYIHKIYSYVRLYSEVIKGHFIFLASQLNNEFTIEQSFLLYVKEKKQEEFNQNFINKTFFRYIDDKNNETYKKELSKIKQYYTEFDKSIYFLYGYIELLKAIKYYYKINAFEILSLNFEELKEAFKSYNESLQIFKDYIKKQPYAENNIDENLKTKKIEFIEEILKPLNYNFEIPANKIKLLVEKMKEYTKIKDYTVFEDNIYEQIICEK